MQNPSNYQKKIIHIDMDAFFAAVEQRDNPSLKGKPVIIGANPKEGKGRGVVSTCSYEARKYGIHSAMSMNDAFRLYPKLVVVPLEFKLYRKYSHLFFEYLKDYSNLILPGSIDEAYVDMTEASKDKHPLALAKEIQQGLYEKHKLPCSIGIAPTLFLAKMASDMQKPMGITVLRKKDIVNKLFSLPIKDMFGIGKKTAERIILELRNAYDMPSGTGTHIGEVLPQQ